MSGSIDTYAPTPGTRYSSSDWPTRSVRRNHSRVSHAGGMIESEFLTPTGSNPKMTELKNTFFLSSTRGPLAPVVPAGISLLDQFEHGDKP